MEYQFEEEWDENIDIDWRKDGRKKLNVIIHKFNDWQIEGKNPLDKQRVLAHIEYGIQTFGQKDGGSGWLEVLERMKKYIQEN